MRDVKVGYGSRLLAFVLGPLLFPQSRVVLSHLPILPEAEQDWEGAVEGPNPLSLLVLGDSTAAGVGVESELDGLPGNLARALSRQLGRGVDWTVVARSGATTGDIREYFLPMATRRKYDIVFLSIGVNDVMHLRSTREFLSDLEAILDRLAQTSPQAAVLLPGIPRLQRFDSLPDPLATILGARAARFNAAAHRLLEKRRLARKLPVVSHTPPWPIATPDFFASDGFHPGAPGYHAWAERAVEFWLDERA